MISFRQLAASLLVAGAMACAVPWANAQDRHDWRADLLARAPVAPPDSIPKDTSLRRAHQRGTLIYGGGKTQKLFSVQNPLTGELEGFDATLALLLAKYLTGKPSVETVVVTTATREGLLENGSIDAVIFTYAITQARQKLVDFAGPYFLSTETFATLETSPRIDTIEDLAGKSVCGTKGAEIIADIQQAVPSATILTVDTSTECETLLRQGRVDAEVQLRSILLGQQERGRLRLSPKNYPAADLGIGLPKGDAGAVAFVDKWIAELIASGEWSEVFKNTIGHVPGADQADYIPVVKH